MNKQNKPTENFDWNAFEAEALNRLANGEQLGGEDGILTPLIIPNLSEDLLFGKIKAH